MTNHILAITFVEEYDGIEGFPQLHFFLSNT